MLEGEIRNAYAYRVFICLNASGQVKYHVTEGPEWVLPKLYFRKANPDLVFFSDDALLWYEIHKANLERFIFKSCLKLFLPARKLNGEQIELLFFLYRFSLLLQYRKRYSI